MPVKERRIGELKEDGEWVSLKAKVVQVWDASSESISQTGLLADETGRIKFVAWKKSQVPPLREGGSYLLKGAVVDSWSGQLQVNLNSRTKVERLTGDLPVAAVDTLEGRVTGIVPRSGYIQRCPECNRVLVDNHCPVHLEVEPVEDFRIKATLDTSPHIVVINGSAAEKLTGLSLDQVREMEDDDLNCLLQVMLVDHTFIFTGRYFGKNFMAEGGEKRS
ncbi:MAG TPA: hypothetical protein ENN54_01855 [Thermoplasmatales archaeon]|nr:hypothetical protein [Thermoplasmatales archaeon]